MFFFGICVTYSGKNKTRAHRLAGSEKWAFAPDPVKIKISPKCSKLLITNEKTPIKRLKRPAYGAKRAKAIHGEISCGAV
tara:strand:- start:463 stop:702 length:240 start_codon:yes stop_codon:yes gene_type:complete